MKLSQKGKQFEKEIAESLGLFELAHPHEFWWRRWPDYRDWIVVSKKLHAPKAPCDFVALWNGRFYGLELKSTHGSRFSLNWLKDHQVEHLLRIEHSGGRGIVLLSKRMRPTSELYAISIIDYIILADKAEESGAKSIPLKDLCKKGLKLIRSSGSWNLDPMFLGDGNLKNIFVNI